MVSRKDGCGGQCPLGRIIWMLLDWLQTADSWALSMGDSLWSLEGYFAWLSEAPQISNPKA